MSKLSVGAAQAPQYMELAWSRQLGLTATVAAYSIAEDELNRAVLEIEGPGAEIYLAMEHGIHRLHFPRVKDSKIRVEILPNIPSKDNFQVDIRTIKHRRGEFTLTLQKPEGFRAKASRVKL